MMIIPIMVIPKNIPKSCHFITFLSIMPSGIETVTIAVINANAVPIGTPLPTNASITGITLTEFAYSGLPKRVASGTAHHSLVDRYFSTILEGTNP